MFGWFKPNCPLDVRSKVWIEQRMQWLIQQFGLAELLQAQVILPTSEFFPESIQALGSCDVRVVLDRVSRYMGVDPDTIDLNVNLESEPPGTEGLYLRGTRNTIGVDESELGDLERLVATLARATAQALLLGQDLLTGQEDDHEFVCELLTVYKGVGVFAANTAVKQRSGRGGGYDWTSIQKYGYLTACDYGYAFALFAWLRNETTPSWARHFGQDASAAFHGGLKYLQKTRDCLFDRNSVERRSDHSSIEALISDLDHHSDSVRVAALGKLQDLSGDAVRAINSVRQCLAHPNFEVRCEAATTIGAIGSSADSIVADVMSQLDSRHSAIRGTFVASLGQLQPALDFRGSDGATVLEWLKMLLRDRNSYVALASAGALANYGTDVKDAAPAVLGLLTRAVIDCEFEKADDLVTSLKAIVPDLDGFLNERLPSSDKQLRRQVSEVVHHVKRESLDESDLGQW